MPGNGRRECVHTRDTMCVGATDDLRGGLWRYTFITGSVGGKAIWNRARLTQTPRWGRAHGVHDGIECRDGRHPSFEHRQEGVDGHARSSLAVRSACVRRSYVGRRKRRSGRPCRLAVCSILCSSSGGGQLAVSFETDRRIEAGLGKGTGRAQSKRTWEDNYVGETHPRRYIFFP